MIKNLVGHILIVDYFGEFFLQLYLKIKILL
jgi:hypothetical protein